MTEKPQQLQHWEPDRPVIRVLTDAALIEEGDRPEDRDELEAVHQALRSDFRPKGFMEEALVESIAVCLWRRRRALLAERGAILDRRIGRERREENDLLTAGRLEHTYASSGVTADRYEQTSLTLERPIGVLDSIEARIREQGSLSEQEAQEVLWFWGRDRDGGEPLGQRLNRLNQVVTGEAQPVEKSGTPEECKAAMLELIAAERDRLVKLQKVLATEEAAKRRAEVESRSLPDTSTIRSLAQYGRYLDRQIHMALSQLERLQRARLGDALYGLMRFVTTADESQRRKLKKLCLTYVRVQSDGKSLTGLARALEMEVE